MAEAISRDPQKNRHAVPMILWMGLLVAILVVVGLLALRG